MMLRYSSLQLLALLVVLALHGDCSARYADSPEDLEEAEDVGQDTGLGDIDLPLQGFPDSSLGALHPRLPVFALDGASDLDDSVFPSPLKRARYNRLDILKRSRLNRLIHRLLAMRGDRYSYQRASPVRFAAGKR